MKIPGRGANNNSNDDGGLLSGSRDRKTKMINDKIAQAAKSRLSSELKKHHTPKGADDMMVYFIMLIYCLSTGEISPTGLIKAAGSNDRYGFYSSTIRQVFALGVQWQYGLSKACDIVASMNVKPDDFRSFILKMGQVFRLGGDLKAFFKGELYSIMQSYAASYDRRMESLKLMLGMYTTLMSTSAFMVAAMVILLMLTGGSQSYEVVILNVSLVIGGLAFFIVIMYKTFPRDKLIIKTKKDAGWKIQHLTSFKKWLYAMLALSVSIGLLLSLLQILPSELAISLSGVPLIIPGIMALRIESTIRGLEDMYPSFVKHLGDTYSSVGSLSHSLNAVMRTDFGRLTRYVEAMLNRITNRVPIDDSFELLSEEAGSELILPGNIIMSKSIVNGADMSVVGSTIADITSRFLEMRRKRKQSANAFQSTVIILHVLTLAVFGLMGKLITFFSMAFGQLQGNMSILLIQPIDPQLMVMMMPAMILSLSGINAVAIRISQGGMYELVWLNLAILLVIGGIVVYGVDAMLSQMFDGLLQNEILKVTK